MITTKEMIEWLDEMILAIKESNLNENDPDYAMFRTLRDFITAHSWQPIDTAPVEVPFISSDKSGVDLAFKNAEGTIRALEHGSKLHPTHWMPLPAAPQPPDDQIVEAARAAGVEI